jgi:hypothetical protein
VRARKEAALAAGEMGAGRYFRTAQPVSVAAKANTAVILDICMLLSAV